MVKKRQKNTNQTQTQKIQTRKTRQLTRILSSDNSLNNHAPQCLQTSQNTQRESLLNETQQKTQNPNQDIDIYFDSCISQTYDIKLNPQQDLQRTFRQNTLYLHQKPPLVPEIKYEFVQENQVHSKQFIDKIEQQNEENQLQNSNSENQSPIFGRKAGKNQTYTPPYKHEEFKINEQSQENVGRDLIDQLDDGSKVSVPSEKESISQQISSENSTNRLSSHFRKRKNNKYELKKHAANNMLTLGQNNGLGLGQEQQYQSSKQNNETLGEVRRRAQMVRMSSLKDAKINYDRSLQELNKTRNFLRSVMYYYQVRESHQKLYSFRSNVFQVLIDEIEKLKSVLTLKREICFETIKKKSRLAQKKFWGYHLENRGMFDNIAENLMK